MSGRWLALNEPNKANPSNSASELPPSVSSCRDKRKAQKQNATVIVASLQISLHRAHPAARDSRRLACRGGKMSVQNLPRGSRIVQTHCLILGPLGHVKASPTCRSLDGARQTAVDVSSDRYDPTVPTVRGRQCVSPTGVQKSSGQRTTLAPRPAGRKNTALRLDGPASRPWAWRAWGHGPVPTRPIHTTPPYTHTT